MSGTYPASPVFNTLSFREEWATITETMVSLRTDARHLGGHRFAFTAQHRGLTRLEFAPNAAFLSRQRGGAETFQIIIPTISNQVGSATGSMTVNNPGGYAVGADEITTAGITGTLNAGGHVKFANHAKVYTVVADRAGAGTLTISPPLTRTVADGEAITYDAVPFTVRQSGPIQVFEHPEPDVFDFEVDLVEAP